MGANGCLVAAGGKRVAMTMKYQSRSKLGRQKIGIVQAEGGLAGRGEQRSIVTVVTSGNRN
jgi:hypothetical protein